MTTRTLLAAALAATTAATGLWTALQDRPAPAETADTWFCIHVDLPPYPGACVVDPFPGPSGAPVPLT